MSKNETTKQRGWLNKSEMAASLGISPQAFDKWGVQPIERIGREAFYTVADVVENRIQHAARKQQPEGELPEGLDPYAEAKLTQERLRLTKAQAYAQEQKNQVQDKPWSRSRSPLSPWRRSPPRLARRWRPSAKRSVAATRMLIPW